MNNDMNPANRRPFLDVAEDFLKQFHPAADCAIIGGSITHGMGTATSDIDIVVLYDDRYETPHRDSLIFQEWMIESFVHNIKAQDYFLEKDRAAGKAVMIDLVANGQIIGPNPQLGQIQKQKAQAIFEAGPPLYNEEDILKNRYFITDQLDDLLGNNKSEELGAILSRFYFLLHDFYSRINAQWTGNGKWMMRRMRMFDPVFADRFNSVFHDAHNGKIDQLAKLARELIAPYGGELREYKAYAPDDWKNFNI